MILKSLVTRFIARKVKKAMFKKLIAGAGITGIVVGIVAYVSGVDLAPADVDVLVSAASVLAAIGPKVYDGVKAKWFSGKGE